MWSGPLTSFKEKLEKNKENHAYLQGVEAAYRRDKMSSPFERGSEADEEWLNGFLDATFMRNL